MIYQEWKQFEGDKVVASSPFSTKIFEFIPLGGRVLDLGCGNGRISKIIRDHGYQTFGMDFNAKAINFAKANPNLTNIEFSVQDARQTNYSDKFFDGVIEQAVLACMDKQDRTRILDEVRRILKPGGAFSIAEFGIRVDRVEKYKIDAEITGEYGTRIIRKEDGTEWYRSHNFSKDELDDLINESGFEVISYESPDFITSHMQSHPGHQFIVRKPND